MSQLRILVVDDCEYRLKDITRCIGHLKLTDSEVDVADTEEGAYQKIEESPVNLAIVDINLSRPENRGEGYDVITRLRAEYPDCKIICISASSNVQGAIRAYEAGANDFFSEEWSEHFIRVLADKIQIFHCLVGGRPW